MTVTFTNFWWVVHVKCFQFDRGDLSRVRGKFPLPLFLALQLEPVFFQSSSFFPLGFEGLEEAEHVGQVVFLHDDLQRGGEYAGRDFAGAC